MKPDYYIGIDAGTSFLKAIAFDRQGRQVAGSRRKNHYNMDKSGSATQDMNAIWHNLVDVLSELVDMLPELSEDVVAIGLTGQGDGTWMIDQSGAPVQAPVTGHACQIGIQQSPLHPAPSCQGYSRHR